MTGNFRNVHTYFANTAMGYRYSREVCIENMLRLTSFLTYVIAVSPSSIWAHVRVAQVWFTTLWEVYVYNRAIQCHPSQRPRRNPWMTSQYLSSHHSLCMVSSHVHYIVNNDHKMYVQELKLSSLQP